MLELNEYIKNKSFPCLMAKIAQRIGLFKIVELDSHEFPQNNARIIMEELTPFLMTYREKPQHLSSFILSFKHSKMNFYNFEAYFWCLLASLRSLDKENFKYDKRVSSNPNDSNFSFSLQEEAFFILMLHPSSPRLARQVTPSIVFNPHQQFERLRDKGGYTKIRNMIRKRDISLQGNINPTLKDFGEKSEILQYSGTEYKSFEEIAKYVEGKF